ncbi:MAG: LLM class oxidoreductase [Pseudomonadota bacterium]
MPDGQNIQSFEALNRAYSSTFQPERLSIGLVVPLEAYAVGKAPHMERHVELAQLADQLGFAALWLRDVPFDVPSFGDPGQMFDPFTYLGLLAVTTKTIGLGVASIILPLRHPAHVAKAAATADQLSGGRLLLGVASGDRPEEYPALNMSYQDRGMRFRESIEYIRAVGQDRPRYSGAHGTLKGDIDMLPKPVGSRVPLLITGGSQQEPVWVAENGDGWMTYPRDAATQARVVADYRQRVADAGVGDKPVMQSLYIDLLPDPDAGPRPIHLGFQSGITYLATYLRALQRQGINHVALNLRFNAAEIDDTMKRLADTLLSEFGSEG